MPFNNQTKQSLLSFTRFAVIVMAVLGVLYGIVMFLFLHTGRKPPEFPIDKAPTPTTEQLADFEQQATAPNADPQKIWLYAHLFSYGEIRDKMPIAKQQALTALQTEKITEQFIDKSANLGNCDAIHERAFSKISKAFVPPQDLNNRKIIQQVTYNDFVTNPVYNADWLNQGVDDLITLEKRSDCVYHYPPEYPPKLLKMVNDLTLEQTQARYQSNNIQGYLENPNVRQYPSIYQKFGVLYARLVLKYSPEIELNQLQNNYVQNQANVKNTDYLANFGALIQGYTVAKLMKNETLANAIYQFVPASEQTEFDNLSKNIIQQYQINFANATPQPAQ